MARAVWSGLISFGLVSVPVGLFTATEEHQPSFHQFAKNSTNRIRYKRVNERTGKQYRDTYTDRVNELIAAKRKGNEVQVADDAPEPTNVVDLLEALRRSVDTARSGGRKAAAKKAAPKKATVAKAPAKKSAAKKAAAKRVPAKQTRKAS